jgi:hypothetical protein
MTEVRVRVESEGELAGVIDQARRKGLAGETKKS